MIKHIKYSFLLFILITGISFSGAAVAAPVVDLFGNFEYVGNTGIFSMEGSVLATSDSSLIAEDTKILFSSTWNGSTFINSSLRLTDNTLLLAGAETSWIFPITEQSISIVGFYNAIYGSWQNEFAPIVDFITTLGLDTNQTFTDMFGDYSGTMNVTFSSRNINTPVPASLTLLGLGLMAVAGIRRKNKILPR